MNRYRLPLLLLGCLLSLGSHNRNYAPNDLGQQARQSTKTHPAEGDWFTEGNKSKITVAPCGNKFCGKITWLQNPATATKEAGIGTLIIKDFEVTDDRTMENGTIHDPRNDKWYSGRLKVGNDGRLEVRGWLGIPALGKSVYWKRAN